VSENDPDPNRSVEEQQRPTLGGREEPDAGDPTLGGRRGDIGEVPSIAADEPDDGGTYPPGGGHVTEESNVPPVADPGPDA
jgi:hypothetical protein